MIESTRIDRSMRNGALIIIVIAAMLLAIWIVSFLNSAENSSPLLISIGLGLLLAGILLFTRIQYIIWAKKTYTPSKFKFFNLRFESQKFLS